MPLLFLKISLLPVPPRCPSCYSPSFSSVLLLLVSAVLLVVSVQGLPEDACIRLGGGDVEGLQASSGAASIAKLAAIAV